MDRPEVRPGGVALVGFSLGGWVACTLAAQRDPAALVAVAPLVDGRRVPLPRDLAVESARTLRGTTADRLTEEWAGLSPLGQIATSLASFPFLLVTGDRDMLFPPSHYDPLMSLPRLSRVRFPQADHVFSDVRPGLRHVVARWLVDQLGV
jgi:pimeloyl-ACP methyl ester carboxylesterase